MLCTISIRSRGVAAQDSPSGLQLFFCSDIARLKPGHTDPHLTLFNLNHAAQIAAFGILVSADYILLESSDDLAVPQPQLSPIAGKAAASFTVLGDDGTATNTAAVSLSQPFPVRF